MPLVRRNSGWTCETVRFSPGSPASTPTRAHNPARWTARRSSSPKSLASSSASKPRDSINSHDASDSGCEFLSDLIVTSRPASDAVRVCSSVPRALPTLSFNRRRKGVFFSTVSVSFAHSRHTGYQTRELPGSGESTCPLLGLPAPANDVVAPNPNTCRCGGFVHVGVDTSVGPQTPRAKAAGRLTPILTFREELACPILKVRQHVPFWVTTILRPCR